MGVESSNDHVPLPHWWLQHTLCLCPSPWLCVCAVYVCLFRPNGHFPLPLMLSNSISTPVLTLSDLWSSTVLTDAKRWRSGLAPRLQPLCVCVWVCVGSIMWVSGWIVTAGGCASDSGGAWRRPVCSRQAKACWWGIPTPPLSLSRLRRYVHVSVPGVSQAVGKAWWRWRNEHKVLTLPVVPVGCPFLSLSLSVLFTGTYSDKNAEYL